LTALNETNVEPSLAEGWETPDSGKTWIFKLKDNIFWQDGSPVNASDLIYDFTDVTAERPDEKTLIFTLSKGIYSPFPSVLAKPVFKKGLLGTGEWEVKKLTTVSTFVQELVVKNQKDVKTYRFYPTTERTKLAYKLGEVDQINGLLDPQPFDSWGNSVVLPETNKHQVVTIFFNTQDKLFGEKSLRQALTYAINKDALGERAISSTSPESWAYNPQVKPYDYDVDHAKEIIEELPDEIKNSLDIKLVSTPSLLPAAEKISSDWEKVGVKTQIQVSSIIPNEFQAYLTIFDIPRDPDQYPIWHSTQTETNLSRFVSPRIDTLLESGRVQLDLEERRKIYLDFQRFLVEDSPAAFLYHPKYYTIKRK
jgi:peptide/nickel transport system substrate-binding protein